jgi:GGDEF domain-containing protein
MLSLTRNVALQTAAEHKLPLPPGISDFHYYVEEAIRQKGAPVTVSWLTPSKATKFELRIWQDRSLNWQLSCSGKGGSKVLWQHKGADVLLMYNLTVTACNQLGEAPADEEDGFGMKGMFRDIEKAFYSGRASHIVDDEPDHQSAPAAQESTKSRTWLRTTAPLSGDLAQNSPAIVLHSFAAALMTGRVRVCGGTASGTTIYFNRGEVVHAEQAVRSGFDVVSDFLRAKAGSYDFESGVTTTEMTVLLDISTMINQSNKLRERLHELEQAGWTEKSIIVRHMYKGVSCDLIDACLQQSESNLDLHRRFYREIDEQSTAQDIANRLGMSRSQWIPVLSHLLASNLIAFASSSLPQLLIPVETASKPGATALNAENQRHMVDSLCRLMKSTITGIFSYPALLFFMEQEIQRAKRTGTPMSLVVFEVGVRINGDKLPLPLQAVKEMVARINEIKRSTDTLSHFEDASEYALLLPDTDTHGAKILATKVLHALLEAALIPGVDCRNLDITYGIGSVADHAGSVESLTTAASKAAFEDRPLALSPAFVA